MEKGSTRPALSAPSLKSTTLCKLLGASMVLIEVHSNPINAVKLPGSLYWSAKRIWRSQTVRVIFALSMMSVFFAIPSWPQTWNAS